MGGSNSTRRVSFESDENDDVTVVKGVRLSENVINRMREPSKPPFRSSEPVAPPPASSKPSPPPPSGHAADLGTTPNEPAAPTASPSPSLPPPALEEPVTPPATVDDSELRRKISEEVQKGLEEERSRTQYELHRWLEKEHAQVKAQARSDAQAQVNRMLASERAAALGSVQKAVLRERVSAEEERLRLKRLAKQLEERDKQLKKQDAFYREQLNKLEERSTQFYKVTNKSYRKAADEVKAKFRRYEISPLCADLQGQILTCYRENAGKTLLCSNIASLYMQCVNNAKQNKLRTGG